MRRSTSDPPPNNLKFSCCGVRIAIAFDSSIPVSEIQSLLPPGSTLVESWEPEHRFSLSTCDDPGEESGRLHVVRGGSRRESWSAAREIAMRALRKSLHLCVAEYARDRIFVHAGVAEWNGRAIVLPGRSYAGKSTLIWSLLAAGAKYYSDEYAAFDHHGQVHPFAIPISLRLPDGDREIVIPDRTGREPLWASVILFANYHTNSHWRPRLLTPGETVLGLLKNSVSMRRSPCTVLPILKHVALNTRAYAGRRGEALTVASWLKELAL